MQYNLRHLRVFLSAVKYQSVTRAASHCNLSQPAVTHALSKLEERLGITLFTRTAQGIFISEPGGLFARRVERALYMIDTALTDLGPRLRLTATSTQLRALLAVTEKADYSLAAVQIGISRATVHRSIRSLEEQSTFKLLENAPGGVVPSPKGESLATAVRLCFAELAQAEMDVAESLGKEVGMISIGSTPLARSQLLPKAILQFRNQRPTMPIRIVDGPYNELLRALRTGKIDFILGALRAPAPVSDVVQRHVFDDELVLVASPHHPLANKKALSLDLLMQFPMVVAAKGTPSRIHFDSIFRASGELNDIPGLVESSSLMLMRGLLLNSHHIAFLSRLQAAEEISLGLLTALDFPLSKTARSIGLTSRRHWEPTQSQHDMIKAIEQTVPQ